MCFQETFKNVFNKHEQILYKKHLEYVFLGNIYNIFTRHIQEILLIMDLLCVLATLELCHTSQQF